MTNEYIAYLTIEKTYKKYIEADSWEEAESMTIECKWMMMTR
jgi:hypothetical protein